MEILKIIFAVLAFSMFFFIITQAKGNSTGEEVKTAEIKLIEKDEVLLKSRYLIPELGINTTLAEKIKTAKLERVHILIQLDYIPNEKEREDLEKEGVKLLSYIPNKAWFVSIPSKYPEKIASLPNIRAIVEILPEDKISPFLRDGVDPWARNDDGTVNLTIMFFKDVSLDNATQLISNNYGKVIGKSALINALIVVVPNESISNLALEDSIQWINEIPPEPQTFNDGSRAAIAVNTVQALPYNLNGTGVVAGEWDGGWIDATHDDLEGRVTIGDTGASVEDHATHVAGTMLGNGTLSASKGGTPLQWRGMAPNATVISYEWWNDISELDSEYNAAINTYRIDISQNSWGFVYSPPNEYGRYDDGAVAIDAVVTGGKGKRISIMWAAGNERPDCDSGQYDCIIQPGTAKNTITVGATNSNDDSMTSWSSWGPTNDGRLKPDVVAPGCQVGGDGGITSTIPVDNYASYCGTSMATPAVSGSVLLMLQDFNETHNIYPLPSTIKAVLIHTAKDLGNIGPDYSFGYGRINVLSAINLIRNDTLTNDVIIEDAISQGEPDEFNMTVPEGVSSFKVTLVWDDIAGTVNAAPALVNNLDIVLIAPNGTVYYPWVLNPNNPANPATKGIDNLNNVEQVNVTNPQGGIWKVQVNGTAVPSGPQNYSLVSDFTFSIKPTVAVKTCRDSSCSQEDKFFDRGGIVYIQSSVTASGEPITNATVNADLILSNGTLEESISLTEIGNGIYRNSWNSSEHNVDVYLVNVSVSGEVTGSGQSYFHLYSGSGVSAYRMDWDEDDNNDYVLENKHLISVYDGKHYTNRSLLYLYQKNTDVNYTFSSVSDPDSIGRGEVTTSQMRNISFYSFSLQEGENLASTQFKLIINITKAESLVKQKQKLFYDGFESGNFIVGGWSLDSPPPDIGTENVYEGIYSAGKKVYSGYGGNYHRMWRTVDTTSCTNITFSYARAVEDAGQGTVTFTAEYSTNGGTTWTVAETVTDTNDIFTYKSWSLPTGAENNPNFVIRFGGIFGGAVSNSNNDWWVDAANVTGICQVESKIETQFNITREMKSQDVDYLAFKLHNFGQNIPDVKDIFPVISGSFDSVSDDRYHLEDGSDGLVTSLTSNRWNNYTNSNYTVVYDNSTADSVNNNVIALVRFNETKGFQSVGLWYEAGKEGLRIKYNTTNIVQSDKVNYILAFTKGDWKTIDQWISQIEAGNYPSPNFMTSPVGKFISITLLGYPVDFGNLNPGTNDSPAVGNDVNQYIIRVEPETNVSVDLYQKGNDYTTNSYILGIGNMTWSKVNNVTTSLAVNKIYSSVKTNVTPDTNVTMYYWIDVPSAQAAGNYNTTIFIKAQEAATAISEFNITAFSFGFDPSSITVNKGDTVRLRIVNNVSAKHTFVIDEFGVHSGDLPTGIPVTVEFVANQTGTFFYYCDVGAHRQHGMEGTLTVNP